MCNKYIHELKNVYNKEVCVYFLVLLSVQEMDIKNANYKILRLYFMTFCILFDIFIDTRNNIQFDNNKIKTETLPVNFTVTLNCRLQKRKCSEVTKFINALFLGALINI